VQYAVWVLAAIGILITPRKARREMESARQSRYLLEGFGSPPIGSAADR